MRLVGCDFHAAQQTIAMLDADTGEIVERTLTHDGDTLREFCASIPGPAVVGIEVTGSMGWFLRLLENWPSRAGWGIPPPFGRQKPGGRNTTDATPTCY